MEPTQRQRAIARYLETGKLRQDGKRKDGGLPFTAEDRIKQLAIATRLGITDEQLASDWGTTVEMVREFRDELEGRT